MHAFVCVFVSVFAHASLMDMATGAFSHRQRAVQGFSHIADASVGGIMVFGMNEMC